MGKKIITCDLSPQGIDGAIRELIRYKQEILMKSDLLRYKVAEFISKEAQSGFNGAVLDDLLKGSVRYANVDVTVNNRCT